MGASRPGDAGRTYGRSARPDKARGWPGRAMSPRCRDNGHEAGAGVDQGTAQLGDDGHGTSAVDGPDVEHCLQLGDSARQHVGGRDEGVVDVIARLDLDAEAAGQVAPRELTRPAGTQHQRDRGHPSAVRTLARRTAKGHQRTRSDHDQASATGREERADRRGVREGYTILLVCSGGPLCPLVGTLGRGPARRHRFGGREQDVAASCHGVGAARGRATCHGCPPRPADLTRVVPNRRDAAAKGCVCFRSSGSRP